MNSRAIIVFFGGLLGLASASGWHWGRCPSVAPIPDFNVTNFEGKWYVIEKADSIFHYDFPSCQFLNYERVTSDTLQLQESLEYGHLLQVLFHRQEETTELTIPDLDKASCMRQTYLEIYKSSYCVVDTDYENYAAIYECQNYSYMHKQAVTLLSRKKELNATVISELKELMEPFDINVNSYMVVDHSDCSNPLPDN